jgi:hypothetical protein
MSVGNLEIWYHRPLSITSIPVTAIEGRKRLLSLQPETIELLKRTGNASETVEKLVKALKTGVIQWHVLDAIERY